jgi:hypothetical protein
MTSPDQHESESKNIPSARDARPETFGAAALAGFESAADTSQARIESLLSDEQRVYAEAAIASMSETLGIDRQDIHCVLEETPEGDKRVIVIDASPNGQHIGLYKRILEERNANPSWYTIEVAGKQVDPLQGCTKEAYRAMVEDARARGELLPDSLALNQQNGHVWTATMMTGDPLPSEDKIWIGSSSGGSKVNFVEHPINRGGRSFRVRPAVVVGQLEA